MKRLFPILILLLGFINLSAHSENEKVNHIITANIDVQNSSIVVVDSIQNVQGEKEILMFLNTSLSIKSINCKLKKLNDGEETFSKYILTDLPKSKCLVVEYQGKFEHNKDAFRNKTKEMQKGTSGLIFEQGIYLSGSSYWLPFFDHFDLFTFDLTAIVNDEWMLVSQGEKVNEIVKNRQRTVQYVSGHPTNQVYLIGNKWELIKSRANETDLNVYLIDDDQALAQRYLGVTQSYLNLFERLIGPFPYSKFDVVENFWETGYGMPSFTLLGQKVMRFPWILHTSYPHELLHNYWGNSVYVDYSTGNWSEGITTYMADYLLKEKNGEGAEYRRSMLQKYSDYVNDKNDYPVTKFKTKTDKTSEAIGYSKVLMINHMLRLKFGDQTFLKAYSHFYENNKFQKASYSDIQKSFETVTGEKLKGYFNQWLNRTGAPEIILDDVRISKKEGPFELEVVISQETNGEPFMVDIPVYIYFKDSKIIHKEIAGLDQKTQKFVFPCTEEPVRVDVDPYYDVMRKLDKKEVPATLSGMLGAKEWTVVIPVEDTLYESYKKLAQMWVRMFGARGKKIEIIDDADLVQLPIDHSVWVLGRSNKFNKKIKSDQHLATALGDSELQIINTCEQEKVFVYTISNPDNMDYNVGYLSASGTASIMAFSSKLMHYGNYSYLGFENGSMENVLKGIFPVSNSPLSRILIDEDIDWKSYIQPGRLILFHGNQPDTNN